MTPGTTLVLPTIKPRRDMREKAIRSAEAQTLPFTEILVEFDRDREGAGPTRTRGMMKVETEYTAFLDDDDELYPQHHQTLMDCALETGADLVYPWFDVIGGTDPFPMFEGKVFNPAEPNMFPVTVLARTDLLQRSSGFPLAGIEGDDWPLWKELISMGAHIVHTPVRTWRWRHHQGNTSGLPSRW